MESIFPTVFFGGWGFTLALGSGLLTGNVLVCRGEDAEYNESVGLLLFCVVCCLLGLGGSEGNLSVEKMRERRFGVDDAESLRVGGCGNVRLLAGVWVCVMLVFKVHGTPNFQF